MNIIFIITIKTKNSYMNNTNWLLYIGVLNISHRMSTFLKQSTKNIGWNN